MSRLLLVRHGQASLGSDDYDQLSELGVVQAQRLNHSLVQRGRCFAQAWVGPSIRHQQTFEQLSDLSLQTVEDRHILAEHSALAVLDAELGHRKEELLRSGQDAWFEAFDEVMRQWVSGRLQTPDGESWAETRLRVREFLDRLRHTDLHGDALAVTSGGFMAMAVGELLGLDDIQIYELSLTIVNTGCVELIWRRDQLRLFAFNVHTHLRPGEVTHV